MSGIQSNSSREDLSLPLERVKDEEQESPIGRMKKIDLKSSEETGLIAFCKKIWNWVYDFFHWIAVSFGFVDQEGKNESLKSNKISSVSLANSESTDSSEWPGCFFGKDEEEEDLIDGENSFFNTTLTSEDLERLREFKLEESKLKESKLAQSSLGFSIVEVKKEGEDSDSSRSSDLTDSFF